MKRKLAIALGVALSLGAAATALYAHPFDGGPGWGPGHMGGYGGGPGWGPGHMMGYGGGPGCAGGFGGGPGFGPGAAEGAGAFVENRLAGVKSRLQITAAQESAWNAYVTEAKQQAEARRKWMTTMHESQSASLPERAELRNQIWKQRQAQSETMVQKLKDLYAVLTPEQKSAADQYLGGWGPRAGYGPGRRYR
jgi:Spy/CpxP family protein refolding chaperone